MKNAALLLLISIYSMSTFGVNLKEFYCCGRLKSVTLTLHEFENRKCNKANDKSGCCKTKFQFYIVNDKHIASDILNTPLKHFTYLVPFAPDLQIICPAVQQPAFAKSNHPPPLYPGVLTYISNCIFLIWFPYLDEGLVFAGPGQFNIVSKLICIYSFKILYENQSLNRNARYNTHDRLCCLE